MIRGEQFTRRLRTLVPLPKPPVTQTLEMSDPEDDEEAPQSRQSQSGDQEQWHESEDEADLTPAPRTGSRTYIKGYRNDSDSERSDDNEHDSRQGMPVRSGATNTSCVSLSRENVREPVRAATPPSDADMAEFSSDHRYPVPPPPPSPPPQECVVTPTSARVHRDGYLSRPRHSVQRVSKQDMASESNQSQFDDTLAQIGRPVQLPVLETIPPVSVTKVQEEEVEAEEDVVWEVTEEDYREYDATHRQQEAAYKDIISNDTLEGLPSRPPAPTPSKIIPQTLDVSDVIDYSESQRLEDLEDSWSHSLPMAIRSSSRSTDIPLDPPPTDRECPHDPQDYGPDEEQDLALLEMDDF